MKAIVYTEYGPPDVLQLQEVEKPEPQGNEVLIQVQATTATTGDANARGFTFVPPGFGPLPRLMLGIRAPKNRIIGSDVAGVVEAIGPDVTQFKEGDRVFGIDGERMGAYAEYVCRPEDGALAIIPDNLTFEEAAAIPFGACTALFFLKDKADVQPGQQVLVNGASGGVGTFAVQLARNLGAEVTGVCSTKNVDLVKSLGAAKVIDYTQQDFTESGETYDAICDVATGHVSFARCKDSLKPDGIYLAVAGGLKEGLQMLWTSLIGGKKVIFGGGMGSERKDYVQYLADLAQAGDLKPVIDRRFPFEQTAEAHRYVETGRKTGSVVIFLPES